MRLALLAVLGSGLVLALIRSREVPEPTFAPSAYTSTDGSADVERFERRFLFLESPTPVVHSPSATELSGGRLLAVWYGGAREGSSDVAIYGSRWDGSDWSRPAVLSDRQATERQLGLRLRKLGNPVVYRDPGGRAWLFFVAVSIGGWSTSTIAFRVSDDDARSWTPARRLVTSPFLNISTLVRAPPLAYAGGGLALPVYHELVGKFGELLRLDAEGRILAKTRISSGRGAIQPAVAALGPGQAVALLRNAGPPPSRVLLARTVDAGRRWSGPQATDAPNPDASVAVVRTGGGQLLLAFNDVERGRHNLSLALSDDGLAWRRIQVLESGSRGDEYSYPSLLRTAGGDYHLLYTWQRRRIVHVQFNEAWLEARR